VHDLTERIVEAFDQNDHLGLHARQILRGFSVKRTGLVDGMDDSPGEREDQNTVALERQQFEFALRLIGRADHCHQQDLRLHFHQGIRALVGDAEHRGTAFLIGRDEDVPAVTDRCGRLGRARHQHTGDDRESEQPCQCFENGQHIRPDTHRRQIPVTDRGECVSAEEKIIHEPAQLGMGGRTRDLRGVHREIRQRENRID